MGQPILVITTGPLHGTRVPLAAARTVVGRQSDCDGVLDDPTVSRKHAIIEQDGAGLLVRDLGSRNGTTVNGRPVAGPVPLRPGDLVSFGSVEACLETTGPPPADPAAYDPAADGRAAYDRAAYDPAAYDRAAYDPAADDRAAYGPAADDRAAFDRAAFDRAAYDRAARSPGAAAAGAGRGADFRIGDQAGGQIHNVGRDQINYVRAERESFLADVAATKTRGRWLVTFGFLCIVAGFAMFGYGVFAFMDFIPGAGADTQPSDVPSPLGPDVVGGVPLGALGFGLCALGSFLLIAGIVLHVSAAAKLRRLPKTPWPQS